VAGLSQSRRIEEEREMRGIISSSLLFGAKRRLLAQSLSKQPCGKVKKQSRSSVAARRFGCASLA
jgi:hypothetical protein